MMIGSRHVLRIVTALLAAWALLLPAAATAQTIRVMSYNIRLPIVADGVNAWPNRRALAARMVAHAAPDIIGTQELHKVQGDDLVAALKHYTWFGIDRRGGHADEHMGLFYRKDRLRVVKSGDFWLSDTPEVPGSITWGHPYPRMVTWAQFETRAGRRRFYVFNTHFPYRAEDNVARRKCAELLLAKIDAIAGRDRVILSGDFNTTPDSDVHALLGGRLADAWDTTRRRLGPALTFHNFTGTPDRRIDWIFTRGFAPRWVRTVTEHDGAVYPSDHFPVLAELAWR